jgi:hypothetical protein
MHCLFSMVNILFLFVSIYSSKLCVSLLTVKSPPFFSHPLPPPYVTSALLKCSAMTSRGHNYKSQGKYRHGRQELMRHPLLPVHWSMLYFYTKDWGFFTRGLCQIAYVSLFAQLCKFNWKYRKETAQTHTKVLPVPVRNYYFFVNPFNGMHEILRLKALVLLMFIYLVLENISGGSQEEK